MSQVIQAQIKKKESMPRGNIIGVGIWTGGQ